MCDGSLRINVIYFLHYVFMWVLYIHIVSFS